MEETGPQTAPGTETRGRRELIADYFPLVRTVASKLAQRLPPHVDLDDLIGAGTIGLIDAVDKFDRSRAQNFRKYAEIRIKGAILDELRALDHVSRTVRRQASQLDRATQAVEADLGRKATVEEVAGHLGIEMAEYHQLAEKLKPVYLVSLSDLGGRDGDGDSRDPLQFLADPKAVDPQAMMHLKILRELVAETIAGLKDRQRTVVSLYYYDDMTLKEIGKILGVTESRVSQLLSQTTAILKKRIQNHLAKERVSARPLDD